MRGAALKCPKIKLLPVFLMHTVNKADIHGVLMQRHHDIAACQRAQAQIHMGRLPVQTLEERGQAKTEHGFGRSDGERAAVVRDVILEILDLACGFEHVVHIRNEGFARLC